MTNEKLIGFQRILGILLSISIILAGICFISGCLSIYFAPEGDVIYSREIVKNTFDSIDIPIYICVGLVAVSIAMEFVCPTQAKKDKPQKNNKAIMEKLAQSRDISKADSNIFASVTKERSQRKKHSLILAALTAIGALVFLIYALNSNNYHQSEITDSMINAMWVLIPCFIIPFGYGIFTAYFKEKSYKREIELLKALSPEKGREAKNASSAKNQSVARTAILLIAVIALVCGAFMGGAGDVLTKAVNICTECIGLG